MARRRDALPAGVRRTYLRVLRHFADGGGPPGTEDLLTWAAEAHNACEDALARLVEADLIQVDTHAGQVVGAYPFTAVDRGHRIGFADGRGVFAYCAIDALGIPAMLGRDATIASRDPVTGEDVVIHARPGTYDWFPASVVVSLGSSTRPGPVADRVCPYIHFRTSPGPSVSMREAIGIALLEFGDLLPGGQAAA